MLKTEVTVLERLTVLFLLISSTNLFAPNERCHNTEELQKLRQREWSSRKESAGLSDATVREGRGRATEGGPGPGPADRGKKKTTDPGISEKSVFSTLSMI